MKARVAVVLGVIAVGVFGLSAAAQSTVTANQGNPGKAGGWPVTANQCQLLLPDAGTPYTSSTVSGTAVVIPPTGGGGNGAYPNRQYIVVCNSAQNVTLIPNAMIKCRSDGTAPVMAVTNPGDVLAVGDCITYSSPKGTAQPVQCISDTSTTYVTSFECI